MADYVIGEGEGVEENLSAIMLMMMMIESDPIRFDEAVKIMSGEKQWSLRLNQW